MSFAERVRADLSSLLSLPFFTLLSPLFTCSFQLIFVWVVLFSDRDCIFSLLTACWLQRGRTDRFEINVMIGNGSYNSASAIGEKHSKHFHMIAPAQNKVSRLR